MTLPVSPAEGSVAGPFVAFAETSPAKLGVNKVLAAFTFGFEIGVSGSSFADFASGPSLAMPGCFNLL